MRRPWKRLAGVLPSVRVHGGAPDSLAPRNSPYELTRQMLHVVTSLAAESIASTFLERGDIVAVTRFAEDDTGAIPDSCSSAAGGVRGLNGRLPPPPCLLQCSACLSAQYSAISPVI